MINEERLNIPDFIPKSKPTVDKSKKMVGLPTSLIATANNQPMGMFTLITSLLRTSLIHLFKVQRYNKILKKLKKRGKNRRKRRS